MTPLDVLLIEDEELDATLLLSWLQRDGGSFNVRWVKTLAEAMRELEQRPYAALVMDLNLPDAQGLTGLNTVLPKYPRIPIVVLTSLNDDSLALRAVRLGAQDYLIKGKVQRELLMRTLRYAVERKAQAQQQVDAAPIAIIDPGFPAETGLIGVSPAMARLKPFLNKAAQSTASVLVTGESGTGKELMARALHLMGPRAAGPFVVVNCAAMPEALLESELFGHVRGAFTGAVADKSGLFLAADNGTLLLDEVGDMPLPLQAKLLRVLQSKTVRPVGGTEEMPFNVRVVAATHRPLASMVEAQQFRQDLYFRLKVLDMHVPPLRDRPEDIPLLAQHCLGRLETVSQATAISATALALLRSYAWPGNVRELQNCMEHATALCDGPVILPTDLPGELQRHQRGAHAISEDSADPDRVETLGEMERHHIVRILAAFDNNRTRASQALGISRRTLQRKLVEYALVSDEEDAHA